MIGLDPLGVVTTTSTVPATVDAGTVALRAVLDKTTKKGAVTPPNVTDIVPVKFVPVTVTTLPPLNGPLTGDKLVTVGVGVGFQVQTLPVSAALVPPGLVTKTLVVPVPGGETALIKVPETIVYDRAEVVPKVTAVAFTNPVPVTATNVPPVAGPLLGFRDVTVGADIVVYV